MSIALVFPGQGSQSVGMLAAFAARYAAVREGYDHASAALGFDLWQLVAEGPSERLNATEITQPAMLVADVVTARIWREEGGTVAAVAGHSLGEFAALVCADVLDFEDAVRLVHFRGQAMQQAVPQGIGAMAAVLGIEDAELESVCRQAAQGEVVEAVNYNTPGQIVIAGHVGAVQRALGLAKQRGAKRAQLLPVSVPAHSSLMRAAAHRFEERLALIDVRAPSCRYFSAVDAAEHTDPQDIRATLVRQLASPVRWSQTVTALLRSVSTLIESGPGKVLTSLNRRIDRNAACFALEDPPALAAALALKHAPVRVTVLDETFRAAGIAGHGAVWNAAEASSTEALMSSLDGAGMLPTILVNNAGIARDALILRMKSEDWEQTLAVNLSAVFRLSKVCLRRMLKERHGRIINIGSVIGAIGNAGQVHYSAAKAGLVGFTKALAREVATRNITVNTVAPGFIDTAMTRALNEAQRSAYLAQIPAGRFGTAEEVAHTVAFLASREAGYITGQTLHVNGGLYMG